LKILIAFEMLFLLIICMYTCMLSSGFSLISGDHFSSLANFAVTSVTQPFIASVSYFAIMHLKLSFFANYNFRVGAVNLQTNLPCLLLAV
jgi:hypothetical protein